MPILKVDNVSTYYETDEGYNQALEDFSIELHEGETLGLIGESGCGKSTAGVSMLNLVQSPGKIMRGSVFLNGRNMMELTPAEHRSVLWREIAMIPQCAMNSLNPVYRIGDQIIEAIRLHCPGIAKSEAAERAKELLKQVEMGEKWFDVYPHKLSGGMKQRAIIAMALSCDPKVIIADESTTGLDVLIQAQILALLKRLQKERNLSIIIISHDLHMVASICERIGVMYAGNLIEVADTDTLQADARHPYTRALFASNIDVSALNSRVESIDGTVPKLIHPENRCRFYGRCPARMERCEGTPPKPREVGGGHSVACYLEERNGN